MDFTTKLSINTLTNLKEEDLGRVMVELDHFKKQTERLDMMNRLHSRIAGVLSLSGMIEAYSVWLMPYVAHELIGYSNSIRNKQHLFCSGHGPSRRRAMAFAEGIIAEEPTNGCMYSDESGHFAHKWVIESSDEAGLLLILKDGERLNDEQLEIINVSLDVLSDSLKRALEYEDLFERASNDALTGLSNRRVFEERIHGMMESAWRYGNPLTILSLDLDKFKDINDNLGHLAGDEVLKSVATVLKNAVRTSDLLVRMGGDEFVIVLDNTDKDNARILAERLCHAVDDLAIWADAKTKLGVSIGLAQLKKNEPLRDWMDRADDILYHAKSEGRSRVAVR